MRISRAGIDLIKRFEGLELEAYQDIAGVWTIGYGHTGADAKPGAVWTEQIAEAALIRDLEFREESVGASISLAASANFVGATLQDMLVLMKVSTSQWFEISRSVN